MTQAVTHSENRSDQTFRQVPHKLGLSETDGTLAPSVTERFLRATVAISLLISVSALLLGASVYFFGETAERHKRFLTVHFFQSGLLEPELLGSGWSAPDTDGLNTAGNSSDLRLPLKPGIETNVNLTIDFSYVRADVSKSAGARTLRLLAGNESVAEWRLSGVRSLTETIRIPRDLTASHERLKLTFDSIPRDPGKAADGVIVLHSIMVYYD